MAAVAANQAVRLVAVQVVLLMELAAPQPFRDRQLGPTSVAVRSTGPMSLRETAANHLDPGTRSWAGSALGADFSRVRVHTDGAAATAASSIGAGAYTLGNDIVFGQGRYQPDNPTGQRLLAHELTHVKQHRSSGGGELNQVHRWIADRPAGPVREGTHVAGGQPANAVDTYTFTLDELEAPDAIASGVQYFQILDFVTSVPGLSEDVVEIAWNSVLDPRGELSMLEAFFSFGQYSLEHTTQELTTARSLLQRSLVSINAAIGSNRPTSTAANAARPLSTGD